MSVISCPKRLTGVVFGNSRKAQWQSLKCFESGTVLFEAKDGAYRLLDKDEVWNGGKDILKVICLFCSYLFWSQWEKK